MRFLSRKRPAHALILFCLALAVGGGIRISKRVISTLAFDFALKKRNIVAALPNHVAIFLV